MKVVIFAGGRGTRIAEESLLRPKPMVEIGGRPILWHIMRHYSHYGFNDFIICLGYKGHLIKEYFVNYFYYNSDLQVDLRHNSVRILGSQVEPFNVILADTGIDTMTAGRLKRVLPYTENQPFMLTYGDGVSDVNLHELLAFHKKHGRICTMTTVQAGSRFGVVQMDAEGFVTGFTEKPTDDGTWINAGFFVVNPEIAKYLKDDADQVMWERQPMDDLARDGQLAAYRHLGFWKCMDTLRDKEQLEELWHKGAPWTT
ncbi:MAG: glucose-1-phosphate cytidylyltransferase [Flavobacteriales bacterium]|nr:glucose-1-phosphate cytidylyltransferase [Flavobacteriales bacterium]MCX7769056.1 glucose-1-phosphate cytidylyltransferase [Flavobacteriales bacterium]MDW8410331.1 glucose-1-phosphate cytidylyltransferase [Flavobacteriales bacterium]